MRKVKPMRSAKYWRAGYAALYICAAAAWIITLGLNAPSIATAAMGKFGFDWAFWPQAGQVAMGVIPFVGLWGLLSLLERRFPAGAVKPLAGWLLALRINVFAFVIAPFMGVLLGVLLGHISSRIGVGLIDLR